MLKFTLKIPKEKTLDIIDKITNKYKTNPIYSMNPKYILKNEYEIIGGIDGDFFWIQEVRPGRASSVVAFYGFVFEDGENSRIEGKFKMIPETRIIMGYLSVHFTLLIAFFKFVSKFSLKAFFIYFSIFQLIILGIIGIMLLSSKDDKKKITEILNNLDNHPRLRQILNKPIL